MDMRRRNPSRLNDRVETLDAYGRATKPKRSMRGRSKGSGEVPLHLEKMNVKTRVSRMESKV
jgi:hypothetical protein